MLKGKTAIFTGATSSIGLGIAKALAAQGDACGAHRRLPGRELGRNHRHQYEQCLPRQAPGAAGMQAKNWGRIINVASVLGLVGSAEKSAYVAAKHGVVGLTKVSAMENATTGVTCNAICPGWVLTPLAQMQVDAKAPKVLAMPKPLSSCWAKKSLRCNSPHPKNWARWRYFSARHPATMCTAQPGIWTVAGQSNRKSGASPRGMVLCRYYFYSSLA